MEIMSNMQDIIGSIDQFLNTFLSTLGIWGAFLSCGLIVIESILPVLPVFVFFTLCFYSFGPFLGFLACWLFTCLGCILSFKIFRSKIKGWFYKRLIKGKTKKKFKKFMQAIDKISTSNLAILIAIPFMPAFLVNIVCALSEMEFKKFITALAIGKIFMVYFWGYIGITLVDCFTNPVYLIRIFILLFLAFVFSKIASKYLNID